MSTTTEVPLKDTTPAVSPLPSAEEEDYESFHGRMLTRLLVVLLLQWMIAVLGGIASAAINGPTSYRNPTYIVLTLLFVAIFIGHLAYLSLTAGSDPSILSDGSISANEHHVVCTVQLCVANFIKLLSFTLTLCGVFYALTGCFSQICFNLIAVSVLLSLGAAVTFVAISPRRPPRVLEVLNSSLGATMFALILVGSAFCNSFGFDAYATHPVALAASVIVGVTLSAWLLLGSLKGLEDEADTKVVQLDFGVSSILAIYAGGINTIWKLVVDRGALGLP